MKFTVAPLLLTLAVSDIHAFAHKCKHHPRSTRTSIASPTTPSYSAPPAIDLQAQATSRALAAQATAQAQARAQQVAQQQAQMIRQAAAQLPQAGQQVGQTTQQTQNQLLQAAQQVQAVAAQNGQSIGAIDLSRITTVAQAIAALTIAVEAVPLPNTGNFQTDCLQIHNSLRYVH